MCSWIATALHTSTPQNFRISSSQSLLLMCSGSLSSVSSNETDTCKCFLSNSWSFVACLCLLMSSNASKLTRLRVERLSFYFLVLWTRCASRWTAMHLKILSSSAFLFWSQLGKYPAPTRSGACRYSMIFTSIMRYPSKLHFVPGCSTLSGWRRFSSCSYNQCLAFDIRLNQGLLWFW